MKIKLKNPIGNQVSFKGALYRVPSTIYINEDDIEVLKRLLNALGIEYEIESESKKVMSIVTKEKLVAVDKSDVTVEKSKELELESEKKEPYSNSNKRKTKNKKRAKKE